MADTAESLWNQILPLLERHKPATNPFADSKGSFRRDPWILLAYTRDNGLKLAQLLLANGATPNTEQALEYGVLHPQALQLLLARGADASYPFQGKQSPLMRAADRGVLESVKLLVQAGAQVNGRDQNKGCALLFACDRGQKEIVEYLLDQGADTDVVDGDRRTPLGLAKKHPNLKGSPALLKRLSAPKVKKIEKLQVKNKEVPKSVLQGLPEEIRAHRKFMSWLQKTGQVQVALGTEVLKSLPPQKYGSEMRSFQKGFDAQTRQELRSKGVDVEQLVPVAGPGLGEWCILYDLDNNRLLDWWHEEPETFSALAGLDLVKVLKKVVQE